MPKTPRTRRTPAALPTARLLALPTGYAWRTIAGVTVAVEERQLKGSDWNGIVSVIIEFVGVPSKYSGVPGVPNGSSCGMVFLGCTDGTCWGVSDGDGHLETQFPTVEAAVEALNDPARRKAMREYTDLVRQMNDLRQRVRDFTPVAGALPSYWQTN